MPLGNNSTRRWRQRNYTVLTKPRSMYRDGDTQVFKSSRSRQIEMKEFKHIPEPRVGRTPINLTIPKPNNWNKQKWIDHPHCDLAVEDIDDTITFDFGNGLEDAVCVHRANYDVNDELLQALMDEGV